MKILVNILDIICILRRLNTWFSVFNIQQQKIIVLLVNSLNLTAFSCLSGWSDLSIHTCKFCTLSLSPLLFGTTLWTTPKTELSWRDMNAVHWTTLMSATHRDRENHCACRFFSFSLGKNLWLTFSARVAILAAYRTIQSGTWRWRWNGEHYLLSTLSAVVV